MTLPAFPGMLKHRSQTELAMFVSVMQRAGLDPTLVAAVIEFESAGSWSPSAQGAGQRAIGLIQFMPQTASELGTTSEQLSRMSFVDQLPYVVEYFKRKGIERLKRPVDYYAAVFWPAAIGTAEDYVIARAGSPEYEANKGLDHGSKGFIATADLALVMQRVLERARAGGTVSPVSRSAAAVVLPLFVVLTTIGFAIRQKVKAHR